LDQSKEFESDEGAAGGVEAEPGGHTLPALQLDLLRAGMAGWKLFTAPVFFGLERVPRYRPALFVGNHTLMGMLDVPLMILELLEECGVLIHPLGDHVHFQVPLWRELLEGFGVVDGSPESCAELMDAGKSIVVFPGGGREVFRRKGEKYQLLWKQRAGFARMAAEHRYPIVPFASVGADDCFDIVVDGNDLLRSPLRPIIERLNPGKDMIPPLLRGIGLSPLPRPERFYFHFGEPIETAHLEGKSDDAAAVFTVREQVREAVEAGIEFLLAERANDPQRSFLNRLFGVPRGNGHSSSNS
jgi:1-acyl-sn-glycerol-3-phosphate acyltransferase